MPKDANIIFEPPAFCQLNAKERKAMKYEASQYLRQEEVIFLPGFSLWLSQTCKLTNRISGIVLKLFLVHGENLPSRAASLRVEENGGVWSPQAKSWPHHTYFSSIGTGLSCQTIMHARCQNMIAYIVIHILCFWIFVPSFCATKGAILLPNSY
jgi:hypothetical protein